MRVRRPGGFMPKIILSILMMGSLNTAFAVKDSAKISELHFKKFKLQIKKILVKANKTNYIADKYLIVLK